MCACIFRSNIAHQKGKNEKGREKGITKRSMHAATSNISQDIDRCVCVCSDAITQRGEMYI